MAQFEPGYLVKIKKGAAIKGPKTVGKIIDCHAQVAEVVFPNRKKPIEIIYGELELVSKQS